MHRLLLGLLLLPGCVGTVSVDGDADSFGAASSGSLLQVDLDDEHLELFMVSSRPGFCSNVQDAYPAAMDAVDRWGLAIFDDAACNTLWADLEEAWDSMFRNGANYLVVNHAEDLGGFDPPDTGTHEVGDGEWGVTLHYFDDNPYTVLSEGDAGCDVGAEGDLATVFAADSGTLEVAGSDDDGWRLELDAALEDEGGDDAGDAVGSFAMTPCEVELVGTTAVEWFTGGAATPWLLD